MGTEHEEISTAGQTLRSLRQLFEKKNEKKKPVRRLVRLVKLAKRGFGLSTDAFLKSVKKFLDKEVRTLPINSRSRSPPYPSHLLRFISR